MRKMETRHIQGNLQNLSPNSRTQAIAQGQREMMEMVKNMPESCYELTLKDIVDHHRIKGEKIGEKQRTNLVKRSESGGKMIRTSSSDHNGGLLLKVVFPVFLIGKKKKRPEKGTKLKVSPKPENTDKSTKIFEKEGWKWMDLSKPSSSEIESGSRISSTGSNNGRQREKSGCLPGFFSWCFLSNLRKTSAK